MTTPSTAPVRIGIIGVGQIGKHHINNYSKIPNAQLVAVADVNEAEARRVAEQFNIPDIYTDYRDLLAREDIQAVDVALHNNLHMPISVAAFQHGKHVYCEKPMAGAYIDAERMLHSARESGMMLSIQLTSLFSDETQAAKYLIGEGKLGNLYHARSYGHRRRGRPYVDGYGSQFFVQKQHASGGALYDMGVYHIAQILYLLGNPDVRTISGKVYQETDMDSTRRERSGYNVEEIGMGFVRLADNITLDILEAWAVHLDKFDGSVVLGSQGGVRLDPFGFFHSIGNLDFNVTSNMGGFNWRQHTVHEIGDGYDSPQHHWVAALQGRVELLPTAEVALNTMLISEGIYLSDKLGREVTPDEVRQHSVSTALSV
jgi:predicted dehydrogenase